MNMISFANIDNFDTQTGIFAETETDHKTEDFSSILSNIFVALQTTDLPAQTESSTDAIEDFKTSLAVEPARDFAVPNSQAGNNLPELQKFEIAPEFPTAQTLWAGGQGIRQKMNGSKSEIKSDQKLTLPPGELFQAEADPKTEKPEILLDCEFSNNPLAEQDQKTVDSIVSLHLFQSPTDFIKETNGQPELQFADNQNHHLAPENVDSEPNPLNVVLKPKFVENKLTGFDLTPNEIHSMLGTFDKFLQSSAEVNVIESVKQTSDSNANLINSKFDQLRNLWWNEQTNLDERQKTGNEQLTAEFKEHDFEFDVPVKFDKLFGTVSKDQRFFQAIQTNQAEPAKIAEQINPHLLELAALTVKKNEKQTLRLRLHPAELGTVEIKLERNNAGTLNAYFQTETESARAALTKNLEQLRDSLQNAGWQIGQMEISSGSFSSTANQHRENPSRHSQSVANYNFSRSSEQPDDLEQNSSNRLLSLLA